MECGEHYLPEATKSLNYFAIFDLKPLYFLDLGQLDKRFYELSRILHPDRFQTKGIDSLMLSTHWSATLNKAYNILKDPEDRAFYLFELAHFTSDKKGALPPDLAEDYFSLQEALEENQANAKVEIKKFQAALNQKLLEADLSREQSFKEWEDAHSPLDSKAESFFKRQLQHFNKRPT